MLILLVLASEPDMNRHIQISEHTISLLCHALMGVPICPNFKLQQKYVFLYSILIAGCVPDSTGYHLLHRHQERFFFAPHCIVGAGGEYRWSVNYAAPRSSGNPGFACSHWRDANRLSKAMHIHVHQNSHSNKLASAPCIVS
jgi:hypothetical protein